MNSNLNVQASPSTIAQGRLKMALLMNGAIATMLGSGR